MQFNKLRNCGSQKEFAALATELVLANLDRNSLEAILAEAHRNKRFATGKMIRRINMTIKGYQQLKRRGLASETEDYLQIALVEGKTCAAKYIERFSSSRK